MGFISFHSFVWKRKRKDVTLYGLMYDPWPTSKKQIDLPGPFFDLTVVALGIVGAVGYFVINATK